MDLLLIQKNPFPEEKCERKKKDIKRGGGAPYSHFCFEQQIVIADAGKLSAKQTIYLTYMYVDELCMRSVCGGAKARQGCLSRL